MKTKKNNAGFTIAELLLTALVMGTALVAATWSMTATARTKATLDNTYGPAMMIAKEIHVLAESLPREPSGTVAAQNAGDVLALDSLVDAHFSPPIFADGSTVPDMSGWCQDVDLTVFDMNDLSNPTEDAPEDGLPADADKLYRLRVTIEHESEEVGTYDWWITP